MTEPYPYPGPAPQSVGAGAGAFPRRMGKPRSFWVILGLGIITFGIYFIVYHYLVALELKDSMRWRDEDDYSPTAFLWFYSAYIVFSIAPILAVMAVTFSALPEIISAGADFDITTVPAFIEIQGMLNVYAIFTTALAFYITFYFLRLNDLAAGKVSARRLGITIPLAAFSVFYAFKIISDIAKAVLGVAEIDADRLGDMSGASFLALIGLGFLVFFFSILVLGIMFYAYWKQTELVNHVWLEGDFGDRPLAYQPPAQSQIPPSSPSPPTGPSSTSPPPSSPPPPESPV